MTYLEGITSIINKNILLNGKTISGEADCGDITLRGKYKILKLNEEFNRNVINNLFEEGRARKLSDFIVIAENLVLICELKSKNITGATKQLLNSGKLATYLIEMVKLNGKIFAKLPKIKYVLFSKNAILKLKTRDNKIDFYEGKSGFQFCNIPCNSIYDLKMFE